MSTNFILYVIPDVKLASFVNYNNNFLEFRLASQTMKAFNLLMGIDII